MGRKSRSKKEVGRSNVVGFKLKETPLQDAMDNGRYGHLMEAATAVPRSVTHECRDNPRASVTRSFVHWWGEPSSDEPAEKSFTQVLASYKQHTMPRDVRDERREVTFNLSRPWLEWVSMGRVCSTANTGIYHGSAGWEHVGVANVAVRLMRDRRPAVYLTI